MKTALLLTLGCRLNTADSALTASRLRGLGYTTVEEESALSNPPDLIVVNTCAVTGEGERKSRQLVRHLRRSYPDVTLAVMGCAVDAGAPALQACGADILCRNRDKHRFTEFLTENNLPSAPPPDAQVPFQEEVFGDFSHRTRAFIKIQEGCNNFCSYCLVPFLRGRERSRDMAEVLAEAKYQIECGFPELVLTGVNSCAYRMPDGRGLRELIAALSALPGEFRLRLGSTEPKLGGRELGEIIAGNPKMCRFLHLSLQHGSDAVLQRMGRHYSAGEFLEMVEQIRRLVPDIHIGSDFIVGFPGETEAEFSEAAELVKRADFANLHIFPYSVRPGTRAAEMPGQVPPEAVKERLQELHKIAEVGRQKFADSQKGKILPVIFETEEDGLQKGWSDNYLSVTAPVGTYPLKKIVSVVYDKEEKRN